MYSKSKYIRIVEEVLENATKGLVASYEYYITKGTESVYVMVTLKNKQGYLFFTIKNHKEYRPSSTKVFSYPQYKDLNHLTEEMRKHIDKRKDGVDSVFKFKYGSFLGINSIASLSEQNYKLVTTNDNYVGDLQGSIYIYKPNEIKIEVKDDVFKRRLLKLIHIGLVKGYPMKNGDIWFYVTKFGFNLYKSKNYNYKQMYITDKRNKSLDGLVEELV